MWRVLCLHQLLNKTTQQFCHSETSSTPRPPALHRQQTHTQARMCRLLISSRCGIKRAGSGSKRAHAGVESDATNHIWTPTTVPPTQHPGTLTPTLTLFKLPQKTEASVVSPLPALFGFLSSLFFSPLPLTKFKVIKRNDIGDSILHSLLINQVR